MSVISYFCLRRLTHLQFSSAAMEGFDSVIFAYGQTASGKTFTLVSRVALRLQLRERI